jgi:hypothetical protein
MVNKDCNIQPTMDKTKLAPLTTHWRNHSLSSLNSDTQTFHSAVPNIEMETSPAYQTPLTSLPSKTVQKPTSPTQHFQAKEIQRQDSGYENEADSASSSPRHSTSSSRRLHTPRQRAVRSSTTRPRHDSWRAGAPRPSLHARHTTPYTSSSVPAPLTAHQFFHFPSLIAEAATSTSSTTEESTTPAPTSIPPPPATCHYWTSDNTRRLEYAAIDAASSGVRGFVMKLIPDCFLPRSVKERGRGFHDGDDDSDAGSVRRYRLSLPVEKGAEAEEVQSVKPGSLARRWTGLNLSKEKRGRGRGRGRVDTA